MKTIRVSDETHQALKELGKKDETYEQIIQKLIAFYKNIKPKEKP